MMKIFFITPFPDAINSFMENSMIKKAQSKRLIHYEIFNLFVYRFRYNTYIYFQILLYSIFIEHCY